MSTTKVKSKGLETVLVAEGGTGATSAGAAGSVAFSNGTNYSFTLAGTTGQVLTSNGSGTPSWSTLNTGLTISADNTAGTFFPIFTSSTGNITTGLVDNATTPLSYVPSTGTLTASVFSGGGGSLTGLNATQLTSGTVPGDRGVTAGSTSSSFIEYNGTTATAGQFDGSTTAPTGTTRLNYGGYLYATQFHGDGSNLTLLNAGNVGSGTLATARGGTNLTSFTTNGAVYATSTSALTTGTLPIASGGTNATATPTAGTVAYGTGTAYAFTAAGTSGQVLQSNGSGAPTWVTPTSSSVTVADDTTTNANTYYPTLANNQTSGTLSSAVVSSTKLSYNPSTGTLSSTVFSGGGGSLTGLNATQLTTGTIPGDRGVTSGVTTSSFVEYNGTTATAGQFDGGTTAPSGTTRLNYGGYLYATRFYGDGSNVTAINAGNIGSGTLAIARGGTAGTATPTNGGIAYGNGSAYAFTAAGTSGQVLTSGGAGAPTWTTAPTLSANNAWTGANTFYNGTGQTFGTATSTQDGIVIAGRAGGTSSFRVTLSPGTLGASRAVTFPDAAGVLVIDSASQTLSNKTLNSVILNDGYTEEVFAVSGTTPALAPGNGSIQTWTLSGNSTPTSGTWNAGQSITLMIDDGSAFTITWTSLGVTWKTGGGTAPTLNTTGFTVISLWKVGSTIYGARVGDA